MQTDHEAMAVCPQVRPVRQGVREHAGAGDARAHARAASRVSGVRQGVLAAVATAGPPPLSQRREAVRLRALRPSLRRPLEPARAHADALGGEALPVRALQQDVRPQVVPEQTLRVGVSARPRRRPLSPEIVDGRL